jgi:hypothetical protein
VISGLGGSDVIDDRDIGAGATLSTSYNGTDTTAIVVSVCSGMDPVVQRAV